MERRLAAILAADVVGYSRLMGEDETESFTPGATTRTSGFHEDEPEFWYTNLSRGN